MQRAEAQASRVWPLEAGGSMQRSCTMKTSRRNGLSRRNVIKGAIAITGVASLQGAAPVGAQPAAATRRDIVSFAQKKSRLAKFEAAVKEMKARSRTNANDPKDGSFTPRRTPTSARCRIPRLTRFTLFL